MIGVAGRQLPDRVDPGRSPGGVVVVVYRWRDLVVLTERHLDGFADVEQLAGIDGATFADAWVDETRSSRAVVLVGYDGDDGRAMIPPMLVTDDPVLTGQ